MLLPRHANCASGAMIAADNHQLAVVTFVRSGTARRQPLCQLTGIYALKIRGLRCQPGLQAQRVMMQNTCYVASLAGQ